MAGTPVALVAEFIILFFLIVASASISGSEVAYFSLTPNDMEKLQKGRARNSVAVLKLLSKADRLL
ncbi:MAG: DUF21 domain-containing protein, partial [Bacteroidales bacterium]|nr:DUF21 domain-containing protein [Bacteroidales bacterium]